MRVIATLLVVEIALAIAARRRRLVLTVLARKLLRDAQASISVPSTEKCSSDKSGFTA